MSLVILAGGFTLNTNLEDVATMKENVKTKIIRLFYFIYLHI